MAMAVRKDLRWLDNPDVLRGLQTANGSDGQIADAVGCSVAYIQTLRRKHGIPPVAHSGAPVTHHEIWNPALLAYLLGVCGNPRQVANLLGIPESTVRNAIIRQKQGLEPNLRRKR